MRLVVLLILGLSTICFVAAEYKPTIHDQKIVRLVQIDYQIQELSKERQRLCAELEAEAIKTTDVRTTKTTDVRTTKTKAK